jgi:hypothetical protein
VIDIDLGLGMLGRIREPRFRRSLHEGQSAASLDFHQTFYAVIEETRQQHADNALPTDVRGGAEQRIDGGSNVVLLRATA